MTDLRSTDDPEAVDLWVELVRRDAHWRERIPELLAQSRADLIAAFGEDDFLLATALDEPEEPGDGNCEDTRPGPLVHLP